MQKIFINAGKCRLLLFFLFPVFLSGCSTVSDENAVSSPRLEFRYGYSEAVDGLEAVSDTQTGRTLYLSRELILNDSDVRSASVRPAGDTWQVELTLTPDGAAKLADATSVHLNQPLAILVDGELVSAPIVRSRISGGMAVITGRFTEPEAMALAADLSRPR